MTLTLGPEWQRELWVSPYRIRFELDGGGDLAQRYVTRFTTSYDRARQLARAALPTENLAGIIAAFPDPSMEMNAKWHGWEAGTGFDHLKVLGVSTDDALATWDGYWWPEFRRTTPNKSRGSIAP